jgi:hypothetical protein
MESTDGQIIAETLLKGDLDQQKANRMAEPSAISVKAGVPSNKVWNRGSGSIGILFIIALAVVIELAYIFLTAD